MKAFYSSTLCLTRIDLTATEIGSVGFSGATNITVGSWGGGDKNKLCRSYKSFLMKRNTFRDYPALGPLKGTFRAALDEQEFTSLCAKRFAVYLSVPRSILTRKNYKPTNDFERFHIDFSSILSTKLKTMCFVLFRNFCGSDTKS